MRVSWLKPGGSCEGEIREGPPKSQAIIIRQIPGGMREWLKRVVLKTTVPETVPGVRIPLPPPYSLDRSESLANLCDNPQKLP
jgi:hypothetical protein